MSDEVFAMMITLGFLLLGTALVPCLDRLARVYARNRERREQRSALAGSGKNGLFVLPKSSTSGSRSLIAE